LLYRTKVIYLYFLFIVIYTIDYFFNAAVKAARAISSISMAYHEDEVQHELNVIASLEEKIDACNRRKANALQKIDEVAEVERAQYLGIVKKVRVGRRIEGLWKRGQLSAHALSKMSGYGHNQLAIHARRLYEGEDIFRSAGRPNAKPVEFVELCIDEATELDMSQNSLRHIARGTGNSGILAGSNPRDIEGSTAKFLNDQHINWVKEHVHNPTAEQLKPLSDYHIQKYESTCVPETTEALKSDRQNMARFKANDSLYNFVSLAAQVDLLMGCTDGIESMTNTEILELCNFLKIHPDLLHVLDKSSSYLGETNRKDKLRTTLGAKKKLKDISKQPCAVATGNEDKHRSIGYSLLSTPKRIKIWLTHIKDKCWNGVASSKNKKFIA